MGEMDQMPPLFGREIVTGTQILQFLEEVAESKLLGVTCLGKEDGGGAQCVAVMSVQLFCKLTNHNYYHSHLRRVRFAEGRPDWNQQWENFFNLGFEEEQPPNGMRIIGVADWLKENRPEDVILALPHSHNYIQNVHSPNAYTDIIEDFRKKYWSSGKEKYDFAIENKDYLALHIRRGDVSDTENLGRFTDSSDIIRMTKKFVEKIDFSGEIHVFSQGTEADFQFLDDLRDIGELKFFLNLDIFETIHRIANAKAIVAAKSAVSYSAALLCRCPVITELWYHQPLDDWYVLSDAGTVQTYGDAGKAKKIETRLAELLSHRTEEADAEIVEYMKLHAELFAISPKMQWFYAQALLRQRNDEAYSILFELSQTSSQQAIAATKTLNAHQKMGRYSWPKTAH